MQEKKRKFAISILHFMILFVNLHRNSDLIVINEQKKETITAA